MGFDRDRSTKQARWGKVVAVGNEVKDEGIKPGSRICIEPLMWTTENFYQNESIWQTDESHVLLVDNDC